MAPLSTLPLQSHRSAYLIRNSIADAIKERCKQRFDLDLNVFLVDMEGNYLNDNMESVTKD
jgi:cobalt-precorrin-5B (C1)-methyltransferase